MKNWSFFSLSKLSNKIGFDVIKIKVQTKLEDRCNMSRLHANNSMIRYSLNRNVKGY